MWSFCDFHYGFRSSQLTADLLTVVSDIIFSAFNRSGATLAVALDIFNNFGIAGLLHKLKFYGISGQIFGLISSFLNGRLRLVLDGKSSKEYPVNAGVLQGSILGATLNAGVLQGSSLGPTLNAGVLQGSIFGPTFSLLYINDLPDDAISNIASYADDTTLYSKYDQASDLCSVLHGENPN